MCSRYTYHKVNSKYTKTTKSFKFLCPCDIRLFLGAHRKRCCSKTRIYFHNSKSCLDNLMFKSPIKCSLCVIWTRVYLYYVVHTAVLPMRYPTYCRIIILRFM